MLPILQEKLITKMTHLSDRKTTILNNNNVRVAHQSQEHKNVTRVIEREISNIKQKTLYFNIVYFC